MSRKRWLVVLLGFAVLAVLAVVLFVTLRPSEEEQLNAQRERVIQMLVQHRQLRDFLENHLYELEGTGRITRYTDIEDKSAVIYRNGKLEIPLGYNDEWHREVARSEPTIVQLFEEFNCEDIWLGAGKKGLKVLSVRLSDVEIAGHLRMQELSFCRGGTVEGPTHPVDRVLTDWYYVRMTYT